jgi:hypothetical protein
MERGEGAAAYKAQHHDDANQEPVSPHYLDGPA